MGTLHIRLFGGLSLQREGCPLPSFATQKARGLFAFLVFHRERPYPRDVLMGHFWGDRPESVARKCLRTDIWRVRQVVEPGEGAACIQVLGDQVGFDPASDHWLDVDEFERKLESVPEGAGAPLSEEQARVLADAAGLYRGDLLEGVYDDWCLFERERLRLRYLGALERLARHHQDRGDWREASVVAQRLLSHDPLREHVHRDLMRCHAHLGDRPAALRQYEHCRLLLRRELDVYPMRETTALCEEIRGGAFPSPSAPAWPATVKIAADLRVFAAASLCAAPGPAEEPRELLERLQATVRLLDETGQQLRRVIRDVEEARASSGSSAPGIGSSPSLS